MNLFDYLGVAQRSRLSAVLLVGISAALAVGCTLQDDTSDAPGGDEPGAATARTTAELAAAALEADNEPSARRVAVKGLVARAGGITPGELDEVDTNRIRLAKVATVPKGTANMESVEYLRILIRESNDADVLAAAVRGLGHVRDVDSVTRMLELISHQDTRVGQAAQYSVSRILGIRPHGQTDPVVFYRDLYQELIRDNPTLLEDIKNPQRLAESARKAREQSLRKDQ